MAASNIIFWVVKPGTPQKEHFLFMCNAAQVAQKVENVIAVIPEYDVFKTLLQEGLLVGLRLARTEIYFEMRLTKWRCCYTFVCWDN